MKLRVRLAKQHTARFFSHLDLQRTLERSLRRASLPIAYTQGFSPHPRISFGSALATGASSEGEFLDIELTEPVAPEAFVAQANQFFPPGLRLLEARAVADKGDALFAGLDVAEYRLALSVPPQVGAAAVSGAVAAFLSADVVEVEKETKRGNRLVNVRTLVYALQVESVLPAPSGEGLVINLRVQVQSGQEGSLKPALLLEGLKQVDRSVAEVELVAEHRLMMYRRNPETGALEEPWDV